MNVVDQSGVVGEANEGVDDKVWVETRGGVASGLSFGEELRLRKSQSRSFAPNSRKRAPWR